MGDRLDLEYEERSRGEIVGSLDSAWAEAEAALPEGWMLGVLARGRQCLAEAWADDESYASGDAGAEAYASTPVAALRALAAKLREVGR